MAGLISNPGTSLVAPPHLKVPLAALFGCRRADYSCAGVAYRRGYTHVRLHTRLFTRYRIESARFKTRFAKFI